jgi:hypothetical protein
MHYLSSVYSVTIPLHVSGLLVAHHQEVTMYIYNKWYVLHILVDCQLGHNLICINISDEDIDEKTTKIRFIIEATQG